jgi:hypothetical protein
MKQKRLPEGITVRHGRSCPAREGKRCRCDPNYQAQVWSARDGKRLSRSFPTLAAARTWRQDALVALRQGKIRPSGSATLREAARDWLDRRSCRRNQEPLRRPLQALRATELRDSAAEADLARDRRSKDF